MAIQRLEEIPRPGATASPSPEVYQWDSTSRTSAQGQLTQHLHVKTVREEPAGGNEVVEQVLSATWQPFEVHGEFKDAWAGEGFAQKTKIAFARFVGRTPMVRFTLDQEAFVGLITDFKIGYERPDYCTWAVTFSPHRNELVGDFQVRSPSITPLSQRFSELSSSQEAIGSLASKGYDEVAVKTDAVSDFRQGLDSLDGAMERLGSVLGFGTASDLLSTLQSGIANILLVESAFSRVYGAASSLLFTLEDMRSDLEIAYDDAINILSFEEWLRGLRKQLYRVLQSTQGSITDVRSVAATNPRALHRCKDGESLERISLRYYGTADNWRAIYQANNLQTLRLVAGQIIIIPQRAQ